MEFFTFKLIYIFSENRVEDIVLPELSEEDPCPEVDFDKETALDPCAVSTYARDIFHYYKHREVCYFLDMANLSEKFFRMMF